MGSTPYLEGIRSTLSLILTPCVRVIDDSETLDLLEKVEVNHKHRPLKEVRLKGVTIHANPLADENVQFST